MATVKQPIRMSFEQVAHEESFKKTAQESDALKRSTFPRFTRAVVKQIDLVGGKLTQDGTNPKNSIRARILIETFDTEDALFYPLFSSHFMLPLDLEEEVWVFFENISSQQHGYWISRCAEPAGVDDINHTPWNSKKKLEIIKQRTSNRAQGVTIDSVVYNEDAITGISHPITYEQTNEDIGSVREVVPQYARRSSGELVIQGSNNTLITLTTDEKNKASAGAIDIVVGRGRINSSKPTLDKQGNRDVINTNPTEGIADFSTDAARIFVSMKTNPDNNFSTSRQGELKDEDVSTVVAKADTIRFIARNSIIIETQPANDNAQPTSIVMKPSGEIIIHGKNIKIGSDQATNEPAVLGQQLKEILIKILEKLFTHKHATAVGPSSPPMPPELNDFEPIAGTIKQLLDNMLSNKTFLDDKGS